MTIEDKILSDLHDFHSTVEHATEEGQKEAIQQLKDITTVGAKIEELQQKYAKLAPELESLFKDIDRIKEKARLAEGRDQALLNARIKDLEKKIREIFVKALPTLYLILLEYERLFPALKNAIAEKDAPKIMELLSRTSSFVNRVHICDQLKLLKLASEWKNDELIRFLQTQVYGTPKNK